MVLTRVQRRFTAWLAALAMVLSVLAPTLAQAVVASTERSGWVQVCSASGMFWVQADGGGLDGASPASEGSPMADVGTQCPWCQLHCPVAGLPTALASLALAAAPAQLPGDDMAAPPLADVWIAAPARAPPRFA
jgi:hypothetical protein